MPDLNKTYVMYLLFGALLDNYEKMIRLHQNMGARQFVNLGGLDDEYKEGEKLLREIREFALSDDVSSLIGPPKLPQPKPSVPAKETKRVKGKKAAARAKRSKPSAPPVTPAKERTLAEELALEPQQIARLANVPVGNLRLMNHILGPLKKAGYKYCAELLVPTEPNLLAIPNMNPHKVHVVKLRLAALAREGEAQTPETPTEVPEEPERVPTAPTAPEPTVTAKQSLGQELGITSEKRERLAGVEIIGAGLAADTWRPLKKAGYDNCGKLADATEQEILGVPKMEPRKVLAVKRHLAALLEEPKPTDITAEARKFTPEGEIAESKEVETTKPSE